MTNSTRLWKRYQRDPDYRSYPPPETLTNNHLLGLLVSNIHGSERIRLRVDEMRRNGLDQQADAHDRRRSALHRQERELWQAVIDRMNTTPTPEGE